MHELQVTTEDYELTIWAVEKTVAARRAVYELTLARKAGQQQPLALHFSPNLKLKDVEEPQSAQVLNSPFFFENTEYHIEWVFFKPVSQGEIAHRSRSVADAFRFVEAKNGLPARLTGTINTGNDVGWLRLPLRYLKEKQLIKQTFSFEVLPTKMLLHEDLPNMYHAIDAVFPLWRFSLVEKTDQAADRSNKRGSFELMWLANFGALREQFEHGLKVITAAPHKRLQPYTRHVKAERLKGRVSHKLAERVKQDVKSGRTHRRYAITNKTLSVDTPENRFVKHVVQHSKKVLSNFEQQLRKASNDASQTRFSASFLDELSGWQQPLQKALQQSFLQEVGHFSGLSSESLVLQQQTGYSTVYRVWQELRFYLELFSSDLSISMRSVADIYEVWCFLKIKQMLEEELDFELKETKLNKLTTSQLYERQLKDGFAGAFTFKRTDGITAELAHEPFFGNKGTDVRSFTVSQKPDIVLRVETPSTYQSAGRRFTWVFDAKYRIKTEGESDELSSLNTTDYVPDDAINQMHRYRDALIQLEDGAHNSSVARKTRPVIGAFALYPGFFDQHKTSNPYADSIEEVGIGAFALLPNDGGDEWLSGFLRRQILQGINHQEFAENYYLQDAARIPVRGMEQVLYPDLVMTAALGGKEGRSEAYFEQFKSGTARHYHMPKSTLVNKFQQRHIVDEIRYLALAVDDSASSKAIDKIWPVKRVTLQPRSKLTVEQTGKASANADLFYLFELGAPLMLYRPIVNVPYASTRGSMKLTTLSAIEAATDFAAIAQVYGGI